MKENVIKDNIYGPKFRKMRVAHHINLVDVAKGITNKSTLAEWKRARIIYPGVKLLPCFLISMFNQWNF